MPLMCMHTRHRLDDPNYLLRPRTRMGLGAKDVRDHHERRFFFSTGLVIAPVAANQAFFSFGVLCAPLYGLLLLLLLLLFALTGKEHYLTAPPWRLWGFS